MTRLGVAVIGCGFQGGIHAHNLSAARNAELVACVDVDETAAARLARETGATRSYGSFADALEDPDVDAVVIATTTHTHHDLALAAAALGKHMLLEKPMAMTVDECLAIEKACEQANVTCVLGYKFRFTDAVIAAREAVPFPKVLGAQTLYDPMPPGSNTWVDDRSLSGGRLVSSLVHSVDLLRFLAGSEIERVYAEGAGVSGSAGGDPDTSVVTLSFASGAIGWITHGTAGASGLLSTWSFQAADRGVNATVHDHGRRLKVHVAGTDDLEVVDPTEDPFHAGTAPLMDAFIRAATGSHVSVPGPRDGTISLHVSRCVEKSILTGRPVTIPPL